MGVAPGVARAYLRHELGRGVQAVAGAVYVADARLRWAMNLRIVFLQELLMVVPLV